MFPKLNSIFRPRDKTSIPNLIVQNDHTNLLATAKIDQNVLQKNNDGKYIITNEKDKYNIIGANFAAVYTQNRNLGKPKLTELIEKHYDEIISDIDNISFTNASLMQFSENNSASNPCWDTDADYFSSPLETLKLFRSLNNKKSSGIDGIPNIVLKNLPFSIIYDFNIIFNNCLSNCYFPEGWKTAKVVPISKKGKNPADPTSYRPISLLPNISKIFEILLKNALEKFFSDKDLIPDNQFGFRHRLSTVHALNKLSSDVHYALARKESVAACLIDLEKAFDTVWIKGLVYKLNQNGCPPHLLKILTNMLRNKKNFTTVNNTNPDLIFELADGMQQGTVTAPNPF